MLQSVDVLTKDGATRVYPRDCR